MFCTKCGSENIYHVLSRQTTLQIQRTQQTIHTHKTPQKNPNQKLTATPPYINGLSLRTIAQLLHVTDAVILKGVNNCAIENYEKANHRAAHCCSDRIR